MPVNNYNPDKYTVHEILRSLQFKTMLFDEAENFIVAMLNKEYERGMNDGAAKVELPHGDNLDRS